MSKTWLCPICKKRMPSMDRYGHSCRSASDKLRANLEATMMLARTIYNEGK